MSRSANIATRPGLQARRVPIRTEPLPRPSMRVLMLLAALLAPPFANAATDAPAESCEQPRARIGVPPLASHDLLRNLALRKDCGFTSSEVYRAAYGDKPLPEEPREQRRHHRHHEDDDD